jgi:histone H1/5
MAEKKTKKIAEVKKMVEDAIRSLKEPGGSSVHAIKKYVSANYNVDAETFSPTMKEYLKAAVASGRLLQPTGRGARGSFKLATMNSAISAGATAQGRGGCRPASGPNRKKGQKQPTAKNTQQKGRLALKTPKKSPTQAKKEAKVPSLSPAMKDYLKAAVASGRLLQPTGRGARSSFKLATMNSAISAGATAQDRGGCRPASGPNRKKGQKQPTDKNTQQKGRLALKTPKKSPSQAEKVAKVPSKKPKARRSTRATTK